MLHMGLTSIQYYSIEPPLTVTSLCNGRSTLNKKITKILPPFSEQFSSNQAPKNAFITFYITKRDKYISNITVA